MVKIPHEALHHLFRDDPGLFTRSIRRIFDEDFPDIKEVAEILVDTTSIDAVERYIDTALRVVTDHGEEFLLIEPQGEPPSPQKIRSWAWYLSFLENKYDIPREPARHHPEGLHGPGVQGTGHPGAGPPAGHAPGPARDQS